MHENKEILNQVNCLFIDNDDTLVDLESVLVSKLDGVFELSGKVVTDILLREILDRRIHKEFPDKHSDIRVHTRLLIKRLGVTYGQQFEDKVTERIIEAFQISLLNPILFEDSPSFLNGAKEQGLKLYLTTANFACEKVQSLERYFGRKYFISGYDEAVLSQRKFYSTFYEEALNRSQSSASETVVIGDSILDDIIPAKAIGIKTILLNRNGNIKGSGIADFEVDDLKEALFLFKELNEHCSKVERYHFGGENE